MKYRWDKKYLYWGLTGFLTIMCSVLFCAIFVYLSELINGIQLIASILSPFFYGLLFAYLLTPAVAFFERVISRALPVKMTQPLSRWRKLPRACAIFIALLLSVLIVWTLVGMLVMQLPQSLQSFLNALPTYVDDSEAWIARFLDDNATLASLANNTLNNLYQSFDQWLDALLPNVEQMVSGLTVGIWGVLNTAIDVLLGIIIAVNVMYSKEKFAAQSKKILYAFFPTKPTNTMLSTLRTTNHTFMKFFLGKLLDSLIIGLLCFILMNIFSFPFAVLISVIIGVTNIIPYFGPFIGAIPCCFLLLLEDPITAVYFAILILALQQFDGNILGPKILGDSTGLSSFWVIFAILLGGGLFGFLGMFAGVPIFAVIYSFVKLFVEQRLDKKGLPIDSTSYQNVDHISVEKALVAKQPSKKKIDK